MSHPQDLFCRSTRLKTKTQAIEVAVEFGRVALQLEEYLHAKPLPFYLEAEEAELLGTALRQYARMIRAKRARK